MGVAAVIVARRAMTFVAPAAAAVLHEVEEEGNMLNYPALIFRGDDDDGDEWGILLPDLNVASQGVTIDDALAMGKEAAELHLEGVIEDGGLIPEPGTIDAHRENREYEGPEYGRHVWAIVSIDESKLPQKALRINISVPERTLEAIDRFADEHGDTRSGLLMKAATLYIARFREGAGGGAAVGGGVGVEDVSVDAERAAKRAQKAVRHHRAKEKTGAQRRS